MRPEVLVVRWEVEERDAQRGVEGTEANGGGGGIGWICRVLANGRLQRRGKDMHPDFVY